MNRQEILRPRCLFCANISPDPIPLYTKHIRCAQWYLSFFSSHLVLHRQIYPRQWCLDRYLRWIYPTIIMHRMWIACLNMHLQIWQTSSNWTSGIRHNWCGNTVHESIALTGYWARTRTRDKVKRNEVDETVCFSGLDIFLPWFWGLSVVSNIVHYALHKQIDRAVSP